jgi:hypothetical protein
MVAGIGQRYGEPLHKKREGRSTQDTLAELSLGESPTADGTFSFDGQEITWERWTLSGACGSVLRSFGMCGSLEEP